MTMEETIIEWQQDKYFEW